MRKLYELLLPIKLVSESNNSDHWTKKRKRNKLIETEIWLKFKQERPNIPLPAHIKLTRISPRQLDDDNMVGSCKHVRDMIADQILPGLAAGRADGDKRMTWEYAQEKGKTCARIEIYIPD